MPQLSRKCLYPLVCVAAVLACVFIADPFGPAGFMDDWSYSHLAFKFAQTGHIQYDGWGSPTLVFQALWAAPWIRALGFSFDLMRLITLPFALGFVLLIYAIGRRTGLRRDLALFGALTVGVTPLFLPLAASFMTDVYGCFFSALCIYAAICSAEAQRRRHALAWLWLLAISGIVGGSDRQIVWVAPVALIPYLFWNRRVDRRFCFQASFAYAVCFASLITINLWCRPPYAPFALHIGQISRILVSNSPLAFAILLGLFLASLLISLPSLLCFTPDWKALGTRRLTGISAIAVLIGGLLVVSIGQLGAVPFGIGTLSEFGVLLNGWDCLGFKPVVLPPLLRILLSVFILFCGMTFSSLKWRNASLPRPAKAVFAIFSCAYLALLMPGAYLSIAFDRYILPVVPGLVLLVLQRFQSRGRGVPAAAWLCLSVFAAYAIVITHDYASASRARVQAAHVVEMRGIPRTHISAGFEYDGWTDVGAVGTIIGTTYRDGFDWNRSDRFWFWHFATALHPDYVVSTARVAGHGELLAVPFTTWLPPFSRFAIVQRRADLPKEPVCNTLLPCSLP